MDHSPFNRYSLHQFRDLFAALPAPDPVSIHGKYQGAFVGPAWVRALGKPALWISGLGGWWGKDFAGDGTAINIVLRAGRFSRRFPMIFVREKSCLDGKEGIALHYQKGNPFPWMFIVDEMRRLDETTLLGMSRPTIRGLRWFAIPFLLREQAS